MNYYRNFLLIQTLKIKPAGVKLFVKKLPCSPAAKIQNKLKSIIKTLTLVLKRNKFLRQACFTFFKLMIPRFILSSYRHNLFEKDINKKVEMYWSIFFQNSLFQTKSDFVRIFFHNIYLTNFCQYLLSSFPERQQIERKILLFFNPRLNISLISSLAKPSG